MGRIKKSALFTLLAVIVVFTIFYQLGWWQVIEQGILKIFSPTERLFYNWSLAIKKVNQLGEIIKENDYLKNELAKISIDYVKLYNLQIENDYLRQELAYLQKSKYRYQIADIISKQLYNQQILFINKGREDGLVENLAVTVGQGIIIGKIVEVASQRSQVQLITDPKSELAVTLINQEGTTGIMKGETGRSLIMEYIPQDLIIKEGDLIITSGLEENIPRGLVVGKVSKVENLVGQIFQRANIEPPFNYQNLQRLTIILP